MDEDQRRGIEKEGLTRAERERVVGRWRSEESPSVPGHCLRRKKNQKEREGPQEEDSRDPEVY